MKYKTIVSGILFFLLSIGIWIFMLGFLPLDESGFGLLIEYPHVLKIFYFPLNQIIFYSNYMFFFLGVLMYTLVPELDFLMMSTLWVGVYAFLWIDVIGFGILTNQQWILGMPFLAGLCMILVLFWIFKKITIQNENVSSRKSKIFLSIGAIVWSVFFVLIAGVLVYNSFYPRQGFKIFLAIFALWISLFMIRFYLELRKLMNSVESIANAK
jgi:hypothetical protein